VAKRRNLAAGLARTPTKERMVDQPVGQGTRLWPISRAITAAKIGLKAACGNSKPAPDRAGRQPLFGRRGRGCRLIKA